MKGLRGCWSFDWNGRLLSFNWINELLSCCSLDWISGLLSILNYKECPYIHLLVYVQYLASWLAHGRVDHVSIGWCPSTLDGLGGHSTATAREHNHIRCLRSVEMCRLLVKKVVSAPQNFHLESLQWNPSITNTIGNQNFVCYSEVSLIHRFLVYFQ